MTIFASPPVWTAPIADLTQWFNWDALGAVGTFGTLVFAIVLATRDSRDRRERNASIIIAVMQPVSVVINVLNNQWAAGGKEQQHADVVFRKIIMSGVLAEMRQVMMEVSIKDLPTAASIDAFVAARSALKDIESEGTYYMDNHPAKLVDYVPARVADLISYHEALSDEALRFIPKRRLISEISHARAQTDEETSSRQRPPMTAPTGIE